MYEVREKVINIEKNSVPVFKREITGCNSIEVIAGTNGYRGGDSAYGCRTFISIKDLGGTDIMVNAIKDDLSNGGIEIIFGGDSELYTAVRAFKFIAKILEDQIKEVDD